MLLILEGLCSQHQYIIHTQNEISFRYECPMIDLVCGAIGFGLDIKRRPGKALTIASLVIAAVMLLGGLYISRYFLLVGGSIVLPECLQFLWQDPSPLYMWWAVAGIFVHI